jgi:hypothetical protein
MIAHGDRNCTTHSFTDEKLVLKNECVSALMPPNQVYPRFHSHRLLGRDRLCGKATPPFKPKPGFE